MTAHRLTKHHGLGNDFLIALNPDQPIGQKEAVIWCDRRTGIGADGLIIGTADESSVESKWEMVLWNADGSRAEISGNGIRCLGQAIVGSTTSSESTASESTASESLREIEIRTDAGLRTLRVLSNDPATNTMMIRAAMGTATDGPPLSSGWAGVGIEPLAQVGVDIGNPHLVAVVESFAGVDIATVGSAIEADYPAGVNVHLVEVESPTAVRLLIWERGAGVTQACGSGACASVWATNNLGLVGAHATVSMPGGDATVELVGDEIYLCGPATLVGEVTVRG